MMTNHITISEPKDFRTPQIMILAVFNLLFGIPCGFAIGIGAVLIVAGILAPIPPLIVGGCVALLLAAFLLFFLPLTWGNPYILRLVHRRPAPSCAIAGPYIVQVAFHPRLRKGFWGWAEDADDIGYLSVAPALPSFEGDSVSLALPTDTITEVTSRNVGNRGLWFCGRRIRVYSPALGSAEYVELTDRSGFHIASVNRRSRDIFAAIREVTIGGAPTNASTHPMNPPLAGPSDGHA
jgi:hypothetical protein